jgi:hypothetical protein
MKKELEQGKEFTFSNENDVLTASFRKTLGGSLSFIIELNCKIVHISKTFKPFENKLNFLISERNLISDN